MKKKTPGLTIRTMNKGEEERLADGFMDAFRLSNPDRKRFVAYFTDNPHLLPADTMVGEIDGVLAGQVSRLRLTTMIAGKEVPMRGLAAVGSAPELRQRGVIDTMIRRALAEMLARGEWLSMLYPFRERYYAKLGWARVEYADRIETAPQFLPRSPLAAKIRKLDKKADLAALRAAYDRWRVGRTGPLARSDFWWNVRMLGRVAHGVVFHEPRTDELTGYLLYDTGAEPNQIAHEVVVREMVAVTPNAHRGLLGFLASLGDQYRSILLACPRGMAPVLGADDCAPRTFSDYVLLHRVGDVGAGACARLVDVGRAIAEHPSSASVRGELGLKLEDPVLPRQNGDFDLTFAGGRTTMKRGKKARARLELDVTTLAKIYFGATRAQALLAAGRIQGSREAAALLDDALAGPEPFLGPLNGF
jgi:predicted acetyltransferase